MKTVFSLHNGVLTGELRLHDIHNTTLTIFDFDFSTINNWYPLNCEYELTYRESNNMLQVVPISRKGVLCPDYCIEGFDSKLEYSLNNGLNNIIISKVKHDNDKVCKLATKLSIPTWKQEFTYYDTKLGIVQINKLLNNLTNSITDEYYYSLPLDEKAKFMSCTKSIREKVALNALDYDSVFAKTYICLGKLYSMLNIMRKVAKLYA
jgi:hypothetical protein